jgi:hypothetical protein
MKTKLVLGAVAASSPSRADVKAEAKKSHTPAGEATGSVTPGKGSTMTKDERKAQEKADKAAGKLQPAGEATGSTSPGKGSETTKEARKAQTKADVKAGKTQPAGESAQPAGEKPMK